MKFSKFKIISLLLVASMAFGFAGCIQDEDQIIVADAPFYSSETVLEGKEAYYSSRDFKQFQDYYKNEFVDLAGVNFTFFDVTNCSLAAHGAVDPSFYTDGIDGTSTIYVDANSTADLIKNPVIRQTAYVLDSEIIIANDYRTPPNYWVLFTFYMVPVSKDIIFYSEDLKFEFGTESDSTYFNIYVDDFCFATVYYSTTSNYIEITYSWLEKFSKTHLISGV